MGLKPRVWKTIPWRDPWRDGANAPPAGRFAALRARQFQLFRHIATGRSRGGLTTRIVALVDALGNLLRFLLLPGQAHDMKGVAPIGADLFITSLLRKVCGSPDRGGLTDERGPGCRVVVSARELAGACARDRGVEGSAQGQVGHCPVLHLACGHSLRGTVVGARKADLSDVALSRRLGKSSDWLRVLCIALLRERGIAMSSDGGFQVRAFDATTVKEAGRTGSLWRLHHSVRLPSLACGFFKLTAPGGPGAGETFTHLPVAAGDRVLAGRGCPTAAGLDHVVSAGGHVAVRVNTGAGPFRTRDGTPFDLLAHVTTLERTGSVQSWPAVAVGNGIAVPGRVCAIGRTQGAIRIARRKLRREATRKGRQTQPRTLEFARCVIVFTTFPEAGFTAAGVLEWYRTRRQVEPVFKRFRSLAQPGHLPRCDDEGARAWLCGKLLVALLVEKLIHHATAVSPRGCRVEAVAPTRPLA